MVTNMELINHLQTRNITQVEWTVYFFNDENTFGPGKLVYADGTEDLFVDSTGDEIVDDKLWDICSYVWPGNLEGGTGVFLLDVPARTVQRLADAVYDYEREFDDKADDADVGNDFDTYLDITPLKDAAQTKISLDQLGE